METRSTALIILALTLVYGIGVKVVPSVSGAHLAEMFDPAFATAA